MRASARPATFQRSMQQAREASPTREALDGRLGEDARVVGLGGVNRAHERNAAPPRDPRRRAREREDAVGGVNDVVVGERRRQAAVVRREIAVVRHVRQKRQARRAEHRPVNAIADVRRDDVRRLLRVPEKCTVRSSAGPSDAAVAATRSQVLTCPPALGVHGRSTRTPTRSAGSSGARPSIRILLIVVLMCLGVIAPALRTRAPGVATEVRRPVGSNLHAPGETVRLGFYSFGHDTSAQRFGCRCICRAIRGRSAVDVVARLTAAQRFASCPPCVPRRCEALSSAADA